MKKRIFPLLCVIVLLAALLPVCAAAAPLDPARTCSLPLSYGQDGRGFPNLEVRIYRVAAPQADGTYSLISPYSGYPVKIQGITSQKEWEDVATTLKAFIAADAVAPTRTQKTDSSGNVVFADLKAGLYLVMSSAGENESGIYTFRDFLVYLPTPSSDGTYDYDVEAKPKPGPFTPKTEYQVVKLWKDPGYSGSRPRQVIIDIYKDGKLQESQILNAKNNWAYTWQVPENMDGQWSVAERNTPQGYSVSVSEKNGVFTVTNTRIAPTEAPPKTGDTFPLWPWVLAMCGSGLLLLILGHYHKRKRK